MPFTTNAAVYPALSDLERASRIAASRAAYDLKGFAPASAAAARAYDWLLDGGRHGDRLRAALSGKRYQRASSLRLIETMASDLDAAGRDRAIAQMLDAERVAVWRNQ
jgi:hypothetical protein